MKQTKKIFNFGVLTMLISMNLISCSESKSKKILGSWGFTTSSRVEGINVNTPMGSVSVPGKTLSNDFTYTFENSGTGKYTSKSIVTSDDNDVSKNESYVIEYRMDWTSENNGKEDFLIAKKSGGKIVDIVGINKLKIEQQANQYISILNRSDTLYYKLKDDNTILIHYPGTEEITWTRK